MTFARDAFRDFYLASGGAPGSAASYRSYLNRIDNEISGIDEFIEKYGQQEFVDWVKENAEKFEPNPGSTASAARKYIEFVSMVQDEGEEDNEALTPAESAATIFRYERELQQAVRRQIEQLEPGLKIIDEGREAWFETGRSDILVRDGADAALVIELKAGPCPKGTFEQVLGYAQDYEDKGEPAVRAIIIAASFSERQRAAAKRIPSLELKTYRLAVQFSDA